MGAGGACLPRPTGCGGGIKTQLWPPVTAPPQGAGRRVSGPRDVPACSGPPGGSKTGRIRTHLGPSQEPPGIERLPGGFGGEDMAGLQTGCEAPELGRKDESRAGPGWGGREPFCPVVASTLQRPWAPCEGSSLLDTGQAALGAGTGTQEQGHGETGTWELGDTDTGWGQGDTGRGTWHRDTGTGIGAQ